MNRRCPCPLRSRHEELKGLGFVTLAMFRNNLVAVVAVVLGLSSFPSQCYELKNDNEIELPDFGDSSGSLISPREEKELGEAFFRSLHSRLRINQDPEVQDYIQSQGERLISTSDTPQQPVHFFVVISPDINAFAGPGGYIGVNSGLILMTESESELASVIAHEIAHVTQRHLYQAFEAAGRLSIPMAAATLAAILIGTQSPELGQAALIATQAANVQRQIDFTRANEQEADRVGMKTLVQANFDPRSMPTFFERLQQSTRFYGQGPPEFLRTHPVTVSRISDTRNRAEKYPYRQYPDSFAYQLTKAKLRVLNGDPPSDTIKYFQARLKQGTGQQRAVALYGIGMTQLSRLNFPEAKEIFVALRRQYPEQSRFHVALAKTELESGNYDAAVTLFGDATRRFPDNKAVMLENVQALLKGGKAEPAREILVNYMRRYRPEPETYKLLAQANGALKKTADMHRYMAEYYYHTGDTAAAIIQAKLGQSAATKNYYLSAVLEERLKQFEAEETERLNDN